MDAAEGSRNQHYNNINNNDNNNNNTQFSSQSRDVEETSLELLIEQFKHKEEQQEPNDIMNLPMDAAAAAAAYSHRLLPEEAGQFPVPNSVGNRETYSQITPSTLETSSTSLRTTTMTISVDDSQQINFDDCYGGLDMLPDVTCYNFLL